MRPEPQRLIDRREFPILYVDDEKENLRAFELAFRREYRIETASSGREALELINSLPIAVVLSDHKMPGMTGTEFLSHVRSIDARTVRVLVTAYGDAETLADAINNGAIYRYISKPWTPEEMRQTLTQAVDLYALESERESLLSELTALRAISHELASARDRSGLADLVVRTVVDDLGFDGATLLVRSNGIFSSVGSCPEDGATCQFLSQLCISQEEESGWLKALLGGRAQVLTPDLAADADPIARTLINEIAADEVLSIPLVCQQNVSGLLLIDNRRGGRRFLAAERALLEGLGSQVAVALENASAPRDHGEATLERAEAMVGPALLLAFGFGDIVLLRSAIQELRDPKGHVRSIGFDTLVSAALDGFGVEARNQVVVSSKLPTLAMALDRPSLVVCLALVLAHAMRDADGAEIEIRAGEHDDVEVRFTSDSYGEEESLELAAAARIWAVTGGSLEVDRETGVASVRLRLGTPPR